MNPINTLTLTLLYLSIASYVHGACEPETPFPAPTLSSDLLQSAFNEVQSSLNESIAEGTFNTTSFSLEISSSQETLFTMYHASNTPNAQGTAVVSGSSVYRIASNTKLFTSLGILQQQAKGNLNLDDLVANYVPGLLSNTTSQKIAWNQITIRTLMAHLSGIPDNCEYEPNVVCHLIILLMLNHQMRKVISSYRSLIPLHMDFLQFPPLNSQVFHTVNSFPIIHQLVPKEVSAFS